MLDEEDFERLEIEDQAKEVGKLTPREYAKIRGLQPQLVYYYIRQGKINMEVCICGRRVIDVKLADEVLQTQAKARRKRLGLPTGDADEARPEG